jgi:hypothetical protein
VRSLHLDGPAGRLEAVLNQGAASANFAALVCHPHPLHGGTLHNKVVYHAMKVLNDPAWGFSFPVLRFNFRGAGLSEGQHDGNAEVEDVNAALDWLGHEFHLPIVLAGFSFGAAMALQACCGVQASAKNIRALIALGLPTRANGRQYHYAFNRNQSIPKLFLSGDHDNFASADELNEIANAATGPTRLQLIPGADHFFTGQLDQMQQALGSWLEEQFRDPSQ